MYLDKDNDWKIINIEINGMNLGKIFRKEAKAKKLIKNWKSRVSEIKSKLGNYSGKRVFLYDSGEDKPFTAGKFAMPTAMIEAIGAENITSNIIGKITGDKLNESSIKSAVEEISKKNLGKYL